jgi:ubiquinone/menaquinone biosynthesis C-methylase UbiE
MLTNDPLQMNKTGRERPKSDCEHIKTFYDQINFLCVESGANSNHFGLWNDKTKNYRQAAENLNRFVAELLCLDQQDHVLDAGCGKGGTAISIFKHDNAEVIGINIADKQLRAAEKYAQKNRCVKVRFLNRSFLDTGFESSSFSKIYAIESVCYAPRKIDFINEAYRLLKPGGRLVVCDAFVIKDSMTEEEERIYRIICDGYAVRAFAKKSDFEQDLKKAGFQSIIFHDKYNEVQRQFLTYYRMGLWLYPVAWFLAKLKLLPQSVNDMTRAMIHNKKFINMQIITYGAYVADKPSTALKQSYAYNIHSDY